MKDVGDGVGDGTDLGERLLAVGCSRLGCHELFAVRGEKLLVRGSLFHLLDALGCCASGGPTVHASVDLMLNSRASSTRFRLIHET